MVSRLLRVGVKAIEDFLMPGWADLRPERADQWSRTEMAERADKRLEGADFRPARL